MRQSGGSPIELEATYYQSPYGDFGTEPSVRIMMQHWFAGFSPLTGILVLRHCFENPSTITGIKFQSPYGDFGTATRKNGIFSKARVVCFSPLTGILVLRLCPSVPAPCLGSPAIFSNLRLFSLFSGTRVKNKIWTVSFFPLVTPFAALFEIFKPPGFLSQK